jgi:putative transposase
MSWRRNWEHAVPFFAFPEGVRRIIYTTKTIEAPTLRKLRCARSQARATSPMTMRR